MGFERIIAYFYRYVNQRQEENCGSVRMERRDHSLKVRMEVRCPGNDSETAFIYLLKEEGTSLAAVLLGEGTIKKGRLTVAFQTEAENVLESGERFEDSVGMLVECGRNNFCVTDWENKEVDTSRIKKIEKPAKEEEKNLSPEVQEPVPPEADVQKPETEKPEVQETVTPESNVQEEEAGEPEVQETVNLESELRESEIKESEVKEPDIKIQEAKNWEAGFEDVRWEQLCKHCPRINAFRYEGQGDYVKAELKDLWYLPKHEWGLANNSFLLHGYYNYRYLLLGKVADGEFIIGVPGRFYRRERDAARRFGFQVFRPEAETSVREGQFGYWCRNVGTRRENRL